MNGKQLTRAEKMAALIHLNDFIDQHHKEASDHEEGKGHFRKEQDGDDHPQCEPDGRDHDRR
jgi:hypothetical protein